MSLPNVLVVGAGGVGTIAALALTINKKCDVTLVVRSDYEHVIKYGYDIDSVTYGKINNWKPPHVTKTVQDAVTKFGEFDYIVLTTKNIPDGGLTCEDIIRPAVTEKRTTIILVQNGMGIEKPMQEQFPDNVVLSDIQFIGSTNLNCKVHNSHKDQSFVGIFENKNHPNPEEYYERADAKVKEFMELYQHEDEAINKVNFDANVKKSRWEKLIYNSALNTVTALVDLDVNRCQIASANETLFRPAMDEIIKIAASDGVTLEPSSKDKFIHIGDGLFYSPSMLVDHRKGQLMELEIILGNPLIVAKENNVDAPILSVLYNLLTLVQFKIKEQRGVIKIDEDDYKRIDSDKYPRIFAEAQKEILE
ncbi:uncharacterized protein CLIB1423_03S03686 [[Candida] railenensis]|uniref:2-dehydropantoate 2-reductase n=1 Tax=[Candida] railenensis TaxID=45579 RepID=A0A9P0QMU0_9ASCO|nr:uncharacterized protein CLIB1423_03S03686 [[Candida] railenensis]